MRHFPALLLILGLAPAVAAAPPGSAARPAPTAGWACAADVATAYRFDPARDRWETLVLPVAGQRFRVTPAAPPDPGWQLWHEGARTPLARCGDFAAGGWLRCGSGFEMQRESLIFTTGQFDLPASAGDELTAATVTGRCSPL